MLATGTWQKNNYGILESCVTTVVRLDHECPGRGVEVGKMTQLEKQEKLKNRVSWWEKDETGYFIRLRALEGKF